ncbi:heterodimeric methylmalonyl-CoA mutase small subunit [Saccharicrinis carchari]|uniref:Methylmalonyl-CoA mutase small subunit n=1 Tax=Saccharicrinis carchari TaxID=1168039 RepID=A0A521DIC2_SACCC|nr:methylmalonyl-CoA mutase small subunit [Saccharicrinis carchari]SMO71457.1 heterodimeric methylmalonyl-CoA mutase small subunit [Saccharicrinis carchari]
MADKTKKPLLSDFPPVSTEQWMEKITADLKGADFEKKLVWRTNEGFNVRPFYRAEDLDGVNYLDSLPGEFPYVRGTKKDNNWLVRQDINADDAKAANTKALDVLTKGVTSLGFTLCKEVKDMEAHIETLLKNIIADAVEINFNTSHDNQKLFEALVAYVKKTNRELSQVHGSVNFDPLGCLTTSGKTGNDVDSMFNQAKDLIEAGKNLPQFKTIAVNGKHFNNAGSTIVQELAFALSMGNEYMAQLTERGVSVNAVAGAIKFNLGVGGNYFMEMAKLRAARMLWATIVKSYSPSGLEPTKMKIHCETSQWNKTVYDAYVNMLRTQTEAMSASLGGADSLTVQPFDTVFKESDVFSERIARNQQLLLKEESHFDKVVDPSAGSYYLENLTDSIAREAWALFVEVEEKGGYLAALKDGFIQTKVKESADKRKKAVATRRENLLGTNQYPNASEEAGNKISKTSGCETGCGNGDTLVEPIELFRGAEQFEALRLATEKAAKTPKVFMLTYGNLNMRLARSQFSGNFFGCAGYQIIDNNGFPTVEDGVKAAKAAGADIVVLCSSDEEYVDAAPKAFEAIKGEAIFVVAGAPACTDDLKAKGIKHFIHVRSNVLETLQGFSSKLGIE